MAYHNRRVELEGLVIDYEPAIGDMYRTLYFTIGLGPREKIAVFTSGDRADAIAKASDLVGEAFQACEPVVVVGKLKADQGTVAELRLEWVGYAGRIIDVTRGRKTQPGFDAGGIRIVPSIGISTTISH